jgi:hypothetical protein
MRRAPVTLVLSAVLAGCSGYGDEPEGTNQPINSDASVITGSGDITSAINNYRAVFGGTLNTGTTTAANGRRELTWDGVPDSLASPHFLPNDFFNRGTGARGIVYSTPGAGVQVSAATGNQDNAAVRFGNINPQYASIFQAFSAQRLFSPIGSNIVDVEFFLPGTQTPAVVRGFGAVYTDIDQVENTAFEFFDAQGRSLGKFSAPTANGGLSFLGVSFPTAVVHRVRIKYGNSALGPNDGGNVDVAVMDDFVFGEPQPIR